MTGKHVILLFSGSVSSPNMCICVYVCMYIIFVVLVIVCILFCAEEKEKEQRRESSSRKGQDGRNQCPIFAFLLSPMRGK